MDTSSLLDRIRVASPCNARWEDMAGDDRARFCGQCRKHVFNFSAMTAAEVAALVRQKEGRLCGRYFQRADGRMLTADCPTGVGRRRSRLARWASAAFATLLFLVGARTPLRSQETAKGGNPRPTQKPTPRPLMGDVAIAPVPVKTNPPLELLGKVSYAVPVASNAPRRLMGEICVTPSTNSPTVQPKQTK